MGDKIKIIDEIVKRHPSYGVDKGWSEYTGGMKDSGIWFFRKMLDEPIDDLQSFLSWLIEQENKPKQPEVNQQEAMIKFHRDIERMLILGK